MMSDAWNRQSVHELWRNFVNPDYIDLLESFDFGQRFTRAEGVSLFDEDGRKIVDFLAGFGVHNVGHNHPRLIARLHATLDAKGPSMLNVDAPLPMAQLAQRLCGATHPDLCRTVFTNSGAEATEAAIKTARAATGRTALVACDGGWHGLTTGSLSLMGDREHHERIGPLLSHVIHVPFGDLSALEDVLRKQKAAAFFVEPIQGEGGIRVPSPGFLRDVRRICQKHGTLLVVDEIQTGLGRTGRMFATDFAEVRPDMVLVGKALSGGLVPVAACLMTAAAWSRAFCGPIRCNQCMSTFSGGQLAMAAGLEVLSILEEEQLAEHARKMGDALQSSLRSLAQKHPVIRDIRGQGLLIGIEFEPVAGLKAAVVPRWARPQLFAQVIAAVLLRDHGLLTQACGLAPSVLRVEPPLIVSLADIQSFLHALDAVLAAYPSPGAAIMAAIRKTVLKGNL
jgi:acetylornithine/succinyldiaminopimelate/putrescine aminotransferase